MIKLQTCSWMENERERETKRTTKKQTPNIRNEREICQGLF